MKLKRLKMQNFRGIGNMTLDFHESEPTILIGINGVGKSSILECISIILSRFTNPIQSPTASGRTFTKEDVNNRKLITRNEITISLDSKEVTWSLAKWKQGGSKYAGSNLVQLRKLIQEIQQELRNNTEFNLTVIIYYAVNRAVLDIPLRIRRKKYSSEQIHAYQQALTGGKIDFRFFFEWFRNQEDLENESLRDDSDYRDKQLETVRRAIYSLIPEFSNLRVRRSPLRMTVQKQGEELIINQLSDGEKCLLAMVGDLARRLAIANPSLPDPLQGNGVVLIDEIELHLHPKWQREIIPALTRTFPNCQFIVTTHSPQVISHVKPEGVYILEKTDEGVVAKRPESSYGRDSNRILEDLMDVPARPQEIKDRLHELFRLIDQGNLDDAKLLAQQIAEIIGEDEGELVKARVSIRRKEILKR